MGNGWIWGFGVEVGRGSGKGGVRLSMIGNEIEGWGFRSSGMGTGKEELLGKQLM